MRPEQASSVIAGLEGDMRTDVAQAIATMSTAAPEAVRVVADTLRVRAGAVVGNREQTEGVGGVQPLVEIINRADISTERALLEALDERDPELAEEVRSRMLTFADVVKLERKDVQQVLRGIDVSVLALAMKGSTEAVTEVIRTNLSERNREILDEEYEALGPVRVSQVEEARAEIVRAIRALEAEGVITVQRGDEDEYVN
jgi:flagellar motor switch protein FliG